MTSDNNLSSNATRPQVPRPTPTTPAKRKTRRVDDAVAAFRCDQTSQRLVTIVGIAITATACGTPMKAAMTGTATMGSPVPVAPFTSPPAASAIPMITIVSACTFPPQGLRPDQDPGASIQ